MFGSQFYHQTLRRYVVAFGSMFDDLVIHRLNSSNVVTQTLEIPIAYGPKQKWIVRIRNNPSLNAQISVQLPRLGFEITGMRYDGSRKLQSTQKLVALRSTDLNKLNTQYVPVPYDIGFSLHAFVKNSDDGAQICEQILPYFSPEWTNSINLVPSMGIVMDVPTILTNVAIEDLYEGNYESRQTLVYSFDFIMKGFFFGPVRTSGVIKRAQIDLSVIKPVSNSIISSLYGMQFDDITFAEMALARINSRITVQPGLLANGVGTTNSAASIPYRTISSNTTWSYASNTFFYADGRKRDKITGQDSY